jgi:protein SCO1/2
MTKLEFKSCHPERSRRSRSERLQSRRTSAYCSVPVSKVLLLLFAIAIISACAHAKKFSMRGKVVGKSAATSEITVDHGDIPGFMSAMTMPYVVKDAAVFREVQPGDQISAAVVVPGDGGNYWLDDVRITDKSGRTQTALPAPHPLMPGEHVPDVPLINQDGHTIHLADFAGKALLVTFIYTRCPMPNFCPRLSADFAKLEAELKKNSADYGNTHLLTISFDPKYDNATVLHTYGLNYLNGDVHGFMHWDFASTNSKDMRSLARAFGLQYVPQADYISHTMNIVLIAPDGTVAKLWTDDWTDAELLASLKQAAHSSS